LNTTPVAKILDTFEEYGMDKKMDLGFSLSNKLF